MADLDLQSLGMRLGEAITPTPRDAPQVRYGTIDAVNADGTLDVTIDGTTLRGMCATTGCVGASAGMRCVVLRQGALATVVGLVANADLAGISIGGALDVGGTITANQRLVEKAALPVLWSGVLWPTDTQTCNLTETVSSQNHGVILAFSAYNPSTATAQNTDWTYVAVPKDHAMGAGVDVPLMSGSYNGWKYVYVHDSKVTGYASNSTASSTVGGVTRSNNRWVIRRVLGY